MATIVTTQTPGTVESNNSSGFLLGIILLIVLAFLFFVWGMPLMRGAYTGSGAAAPQVQVPHDVNVNVHTPGK